MAMAMCVHLEVLTQQTDQHATHLGMVNNLIELGDTLHFDRRLRLEFHGATITSDAGLLACRELDDALGLTETATATACLQESRGGRNVQHQLVPLLR